MKKVLCVAAAVVLTLAAVALGAWRGWSGKRASVLASFSSDSGLRDYLDTRSMDAANLRVVAARHLTSDDAYLVALSRDRKVLADAQASVEEIVAADAELTKTAASLQKELPTLASVQSSSRDQAYITTLTRALLETQSVTDSYNEQVSSYNQRLNANGWSCTNTDPSLMPARALRIGTYFRDDTMAGKLAQVLGVQPLTAYGE